MMFHYRKASAITLIELIAVVGLITVLALIALPVLARSRDAQRQLTCLSNLRNVGAAIAVYASDHSFQLPGPCWRGQSPIYNADATGEFDKEDGQMASLLAPYLHLKRLLPGRSAFAEILTCPAWLRSANVESETVCYYSAGELSLTPEQTLTPEEQTLLFPFGRSGGNPIPPTRITAIPDPAATPAIWEFDKRIANGDFYPTDPRVPRTPVHKTTRNVLFFDGHVAPGQVTF